MAGSSVYLAGKVVQLPPSIIDQTVDPADQLLAEYGLATPVEHVLLLGASNGVLPVVASGHVGAGEVLVVDQRTHALAAAAETVRFNGTNARLLPTDDLPLLPSSSFDHALINIAFQPNSVRLVELLRETHRLLQPGGRAYIAGARDRGADTAIKRLGEVFGRSQMIAYRKGYRIGVAVRTDTVDPPTEAAKPQLSTVELRGSQYTLEAHVGVFARGGLDPAAVMLASAMEVAPGDQVLDLGCGNGIVGMVAARLATQGHVWLVDTNTEAVALTGRNIERNAIANATALASDSTAAVASQRFDVVVCNPPFHEGGREVRDLGQRFITDAVKVLRSEGRCFIVANRFLAYEAAMRGILRDVREVTGDKRYKVLSGVRP